MAQVHAKLHRRLPCPTRAPAAGRIYHVRAHTPTTPTTRGYDVRPPPRIRCRPPPHTLCTLYPIPQSRKLGWSRLGQHRRSGRNLPRSSLMIKLTNFLLFFPETPPPPLPRYPPHTHLGEISDGVVEAAERVEGAAAVEKRAGVRGVQPHGFREVCGLRHREVLD
jgi:hypothetical protein